MSMKVPKAIASQIPPQPYVHLHVTLLTTTSPSPNPKYFGLRDGSSLPKMILTTYEGVRNGGERPEFNSLSFHGAAIQREPNGKREWVAKIFSKQRISDEWLNKVFEGVGWVHRKEVGSLLLLDSFTINITTLIKIYTQWDAYPRLPPTTKFPPVKLDHGLFYVNAFEPYAMLLADPLPRRLIVNLADLSRP